MRRRDFIAFVGSGAAVWPLKLNAYRSATPVVGFLYSGYGRSIWKSHSSKV